MRTNFVGNSVVSAITHTPASNPLELATTPVISLLPILTGTRRTCFALTSAVGSIRDRASKIVNGTNLRLFIKPPGPAAPLNRQHNYTGTISGKPTRSGSNRNCAESTWRAVPPSHRGGRETPQLRHSG